MQRRQAKPIRVFFSPLTRRFWATRAYKELPGGIMQCTGQKFDVTQDVAGIIQENGIVFEAKAPKDSNSA